MAISLEKGQRISLEKNGASILKVCVGVNWGTIVKPGLLWGTNEEDVDLDASCAMYDGSKQMKELVYFGNLQSACGSVFHSGDDLSGDAGGIDDGLDNEVITVDFGRIPSEINNVVFVLNSFQGQDFKDIPYAHIRLYEGTPQRVDEVLAKLDIANDPAFAGKVSMVLGRFYRKDNDWKFQSIGEAINDRDLEETVRTVAMSYLD
jgi:tellurium resistance protein TerZ